MSSNSITENLANTLAASRKGTFSGLIIRKTGVTRGRGSSKQVYGDDLVHVTLITGFSYESLVKRSLDQVNERLAAGNPFIDQFVGRCTRKGITGKDGAAITHADVEKALRDLKESFERTLDGTNVATTDDVYEPLVVDGETVRGCRVYKGNPNGDDAAEPGTIYLQGLKISETVIEAAPNGPIPASNSRGDVVAKRIIKAALPAGRYRSYKLAKGGDWLLNAGGAAAAAATKHGVTLDESEVETALHLLTASA